MRREWSLRTTGGGADQLAGVLLHNNDLGLIDPDRNATAGEGWLAGDGRCDRSHIGT